MSELEQTELLKLAARASGAGRLENPDGSAEIRNPFCGDRLKLDVRLEDGKVTEIGYEIRACLVCQAAASIVGEQMRGRSVEDIAAIGEQVEKYLKDGGEAPEPFALFEPMKPHLNRHVCILMPFRGVAEAAADAV